MGVYRRPSVYHHAYEGHSVSYLVGQSQPATAGDKESCWCTPATLNVENITVCRCKLLKAWGTEICSCVSSACKMPVSSACKMPAGIPCMPVPDSTKTWLTVHASWCLHHLLLPCAPFEGRCDGLRAGTNIYTVFPRLTWLLGVSPSML
jgi:hypothetical protein